jgi:ribose transport system permease protein
VQVRTGEPMNDALKRSRTRRVGGNVPTLLLDLTMPIALVALVVYFAAQTEAFLTTENLAAVTIRNAPLIIVVTLAAMLMMAGYIDLSVGSNLALSGVVTAMLFQSFGVAVGVVGGLATGLLIGLANGVLVGVLQFSPVIVTLGGWIGIRGTAQALATDSLFGFHPSVVAFAGGTTLGIPNLTWIAILVVAVAMVLMSWMPVGRHIVAIGVNPRAARLVGIPVSMLVLALYGAVGVAAGLAGVLQVARLDSAPSGTLGMGFEITVITAIMLGGVPFTGGHGNLWRVLLGVAVIAVLSSGLILMNVQPAINGIVTGLVLVVAATLEGLRRRS